MLALAVLLLALAGNASAVYAVPLPSHPPATYHEAVLVVDTLHQVMSLLYNNRCDAFMLLEDAQALTANGSVRLARGSLIVIGARPPRSLRVLRLGPVRALRLSAPRIGIYVGEGSAPGSAMRALEALGFEYVRLDSANLTTCLRTLDVLLIPGGTSEDIVGALGWENCKAIRDFVRSGGGYIGICAGAYAPVKGFTSTTSMLELVNAKVRNWPLWSLGVGIVTLLIVNDTVPVLYGFGGLNDTFRMIYWNGPVFDPLRFLPEASDAHPLALYLRVGNASEFASEVGAPYAERMMRGGYAIVVAEYGAGRIVLFGPHPDIYDASGRAPDAVLTPYVYRMLFSAVHFVSPDAEIVELGVRDQSLVLLKPLGRPALPRLASPRIVSLHRALSAEAGSRLDPFLLSMLALLAALLVGGLLYGVRSYRRAARRRGASSSTGV